MRTFEKNYIGKGRKVEDLDIVTITLKMEEAEKFAFKKDGKKYLRFQVYSLSSSDKYNRTHTCYVPKMVTVNEDQPRLDTKTGMYCLYPNTLVHEGKIGG